MDDDKKREEAISRAMEKAKDVFSGPKRDPARIDRVLNLIRHEWMKSTDLRLCQLLHAVLDSPRDLFYVEDDTLENALRDWITKKEKT